MVAGARSELTPRVWQHRVSLGPSVKQGTTDRGWPRAGKGSGRGCRGTVQGSRGDFQDPAACMPNELARQMEESPAHRGRWRCQPLGEGGMLEKDEEIVREDADAGRRRHWQPTAHRHAPMPKPIFSSLMPFRTSRRAADTRSGCRQPTRPGCWRSHGTSANRRTVRLGACTSRRSAGKPFVSPMPAPPGPRSRHTSSTRLRESLRQWPAGRGASSRPPMAKVLPVSSQ